MIFLSGGAGNLGFELGMTLKFYISESKRLNLKLKKILGLIFTFGEVTGEKLVGIIFLLEMIYSKSRNQLSIESMENLLYGRITFSSQNCASL